VYSRHTAPNTTRFEAILSDILKGPSLSYASGLSAFHAMLVFLNPKRIAIRDGYHGCHGVIEVHQKLTGLRKLDIDCPTEELQAGDILHIETPLNPTGSAYNLKAYAEKAHSRGAFLTVDSTFGPPPLQDPFLWGADIVMHSGTKYIGGHSDMLCGILAVNPMRAKEGWWDKLFEERLYLGNVMGSMEGWLGVRSLRTLELRVERQSQTATKLVAWLDNALNAEEPDRDPRVIRDVLGKIEHASLQKDDIKDGWLLKQMPNGYGPVFSITMKEQSFARRLPSKLQLFHHATSLGGVESLIEWRTMTDSSVDTRLLRVSIGVEGFGDLRDDLLQAFKALSAESQEELKR
jgi:cystathionine beta-lyase/cystathionine gamma-synthase